MTTSENNPYRKHVGNAQCPPLADIYLETFGVKNNGYFVEVGAFNGTNWSATHGLTKMGWGGLLFEPQRDFYNQCNRLYERNKKVSVENCAILDHGGKVKLYIGGSLSTTSEERVKIYQDVWWAKSSRLRLEEFVEVSAFTLDQMFAKHKVHPNFDLLVIDVEGAEAQVLNGLSFDKYHPKLMMVETHEENEDERLSKTAGEVEEIVFEYGYKKLFANHINTVYRREK